MSDPVPLREAILELTRQWRETGHIVARAFAAEIERAIDAAEAEAQCDVREIETREE